ncbi:SpoIIIAH-like family protein [Microaerobacter geothermalis]|uniref:SpoIIIAH-like family protein n=1 Tax=Microaerobacter geothermalis TaxID=674972 RepID=UPI001F312FF8|nr:SpoIIIAH-like family protein [Microaerobacter geothermalis]MCF6094450.1 SpoIIIAH-like family protein [Microaerobacter geothermalis]
MTLKKQTIWLLSMLTLMIVLAAYLLFSTPVNRIQIVDNNQEQNSEEMVTITENIPIPEGNQPQSSVLKNSNDYFVSYKLQREILRSQQIEQLKEVLTSDASAEAIAQAKASIDKIQALEDVELQLEELIKAEGYNDAVVISKDDRVTVIIQSDEPERTQIVKIIKLVSDQLKVSGSNVTVSFKP